MNRRKFNTRSLIMLTGLGLTLDAANALTLEELTQGEAARGLRAALERGIQQAVGQLGQLNGSLGNDKVRIPLPKQLEDGAQLLRWMGQGGRLDELVVAMNRAAEAAVPLARDLMVSAVKSMSVSDARKILGGGDTSVSEFFAEKTRAPLTEKFLPVVARTTRTVGAAEHYNHLAGKAADLGLMRREESNIERYVTDKSLTGLYFVIGEEERKIRSDPVGTGSALLKKVFGALK